jgi:hypothetical protein
MYIPTYSIHTYNRNAKNKLGVLTQWLDRRNTQALYEMSYDAQTSDFDDQLSGTNCWKGDENLRPVYRFLDETFFVRTFH